MPRYSSIFLSLSFAIFLAALHSPVSVRPQVSHLSPEDPDLRIRRIEEGLLPAAIIQGQSLPRMRLTDRMRHYDVPGVSIAVFDNGQLLWARGYGLADISANKSVTPETLFQAASISKSVTAFAVLRLVQQGKLNLDEDANRKPVSWKVPESEFTRTEKVTLRRLLSHTAGLNVPSVGGYLAGEPLPTVVQVLDGQKPASNEPIRVEQTPGKEFRYCPVVANERNPQDFPGTDERTRIRTFGNEAQHV
jgi:CubicO group peptidase (beta-lactamase class C family)